jgi:hypothetical protein
MNILEQRLTSDRIDVYAIAGLGVLCLAMATVLPDIWNFAALSAGVVNLFWAHRLHVKPVKVKVTTRSWRWN